MDPVKPECAHCGSKSKTIKVYMSTRNLLKIPMKTHYCKACAKIVVPKEQPV